MTCATRALSAVALLVAAHAAATTLPLGPPALLPGAQPDPAPPPPNVWQPRGAAEIQVLDKVYARRATLTIRDGETGAFGTLTVAVRACVIRPPDRAPDAAAYLTVTDSRMDRPAFAGWMLRSAPAASMLEHPIYDIRITACR